MASDPHIDHSDLPTAARDIHREYGGPGIMLKMADEIERLRAALQKIADAPTGPSGQTANERFCKELALNAIAQEESK